MKASAKSDGRGLGVGLIGTGYMGKCHALAWNAVASTFGDVIRPRLVAVAEASADLARTKALELGFATSTGDWRELLADPQIDVISITTPNRFHAEMAIAALEAGKHVWCEKPMATVFADVQAMHAAWRGSGKVAVLGYNYIQNPAMRLIRKLIGEGTIGVVNHVRLEMDEDFMADRQTPFATRNEASAGYGALDDFAVHPLSLLRFVLGGVAEVFGEMARPYADRPHPDGGRRAIENYDIATALLRLESGASGVLTVNRAAWGRKGRIQLQIFGDAGAIVFDQERFNEVQLFRREGSEETQGFRTILSAPVHKPYDRFIPAPGHGLGFNDLKVIECRELIARIEGEKASVFDFDDGLAIERTVHAIADSFAKGRWVEVKA
ncbi:myo-inositol 2-dehydrogenase [Labrys sp. WJW]|uniref:Gfo/Idh/MocA family protein n=1 Tax=Labrys sp. WJW TaxID=1737983 RepID=UPI00082ED357|nr:Gfo/Idh/MocA family oxidoreductase [Labrys sp. WJW]OCC06638.1 myo-inositol 2-dehydrogenase [Labrys sp. WJW]